MTRRDLPHVQKLELLGIAGQNFHAFVSQAVDVSEGKTLEGGIVENQGRGDGHFAAAPAPRQVHILQGRGGAEERRHGLLARPTAARQLENWRKDARGIGKENSAEQRPQRGKRPYFSNGRRSRWWRAQI